MKTFLKQLFCRHNWKVKSKPTIYQEISKVAFWSCNHKCSKCDKKRVYKDWFGKDLTRN